MPDSTVRNRNRPFPFAYKQRVDAFMCLSFCVCVCVFNLCLSDWPVTCVQLDIMIINMYIILLSKGMHYGVQWVL